MIARMTARVRVAVAGAVVCGIGTLSLAGGAAENGFDPGTPEDREALFDFLLKSTMEWDAFASLPNHPYYRAHPKGIDVEAAMLGFRDELINADTAEKMWFALHKLSNARKDTHLRLGLVDGGIELSEKQQRRLEAPIRFAVDFSDAENPFFFVSDFGEGVRTNVGDRVLSINGMETSEYVEKRRPYHRYSTNNHYLWRLGYDISRMVDFVPHDEFYGESLRLRLQRADGRAYNLDLPYVRRSSIDWRGYAERRYPGFSPVEGMAEFETYSLYLPNDRSLPVVLLQWHGFRADLPEAMDRLMEYAQEHDLLDHHVIVDATRSRGGSRGAYAVQRLQPRPFRTTFGNLMVSDASKRWVENRIRSIRRTGSAAETVDGGNWLLEWLEDDVQKAFDAGMRYTNSVPFKGAHLPKWADGIIDPADVHFRGEMTVWLAPWSGSHLDQFASQVVDNDLAHVMGMSSGGFSNTWQTTETLRFPTNGRPIVDYQWSLGHSLRPNGEILQYNPAEVHEYIPQTRENFLDYHADLLRRTLDRLGLTAAEAEASAR